MDDKPVLFERRCTSCNALLFKGVIELGHIEHKCKCGVINTIKADNWTNKSNASALEKPVRNMLNNYESTQKYMRRFVNK